VAVFVTKLENSYWGKVVVCARGLHCGTYFLLVFVSSIPLLYFLPSLFILSFFTFFFLLSCGGGG